MDADQRYRDFKVTNITRHPSKDYEFLNSINDVSKEIIPEKPNELSKNDTTQTVLSNRDVAITKSGKKKRAKKNDNALQDSAIAKRDIVKEIIPEKTEVRKDSIQSVNPNTDIALLRSVIKRKLKKNSKDGIEMVYIDDNGDTKDTIRILVPSDKKNKDDEIKITEPVFTSIPQNDKPKEIVSDKNKKDTKISD